MPSFRDQAGNTISLNGFPKRIVSIVPSQTELLYDLGLEESVVGITKFCIYPDKWFRSKQRVGGTKDLHIAVIRQLRPDLIIANKEENEKAQVELLAAEFPVWISDIKNLEGALHMIQSIGEITDRREKASTMIHQIRENFKQLVPLSPPIPSAYFIWQEPYMTIGGDTFISDMMQRCGLDNIFHNSHRYPETSVHELRDKNCRLLLLSSEPFPFKEKHAFQLQSLLPDTKIVLADGEYFSWYGSRLLQSPAYFRQLIQSLSNIT